MGASSGKSLKRYSSYSNCVDCKTSIYNGNGAKLYCAECKRKRNLKAGRRTQEKNKKFELPKAFMVSE